ncbi:phosphotransferase enzyme family-domain-containing protein [Daedaleopsis nitida]|nr:phosphotransferase enzyme family-domain-containing protein [Daedaleopsis nitida]
MVLSSFWDKSSKHVMFEQYPDSFAHWQRSQPLEQSRQKLLDLVESKMGVPVFRTEERSMSVSNLTLEVELEDGQQYIVRVPILPSSEKDNAYVARSLEKFNCEVALLAWLTEETSLPVPHVYHVVCSSPDDSCTFAIVEKLPGRCLLNVYGGLPYSEKESIVHATADVMLQLAQLNVPQQIGTPMIMDGVVVTVPLIPVEPEIVPERIFDTLEDYIYALIEVRRRSTRVACDDASRAAANLALDRLTAELPAIFARVSAPSYRRCVLNHEDMRETNVLMDAQGKLTGIVDWEFHSTKPLVLAARYPVWIRYDGIYDPRFALSEGTCWVCSPEDAARLRALYSDIVKSKDEDYWRALVEGELLRQIEEWLVEQGQDMGLVGFSRWMDSAFPTTSSEQYTRRSG